METNIENTDFYTTLCQAPHGSVLNFFLWCLNYMRNTKSRPRLNLISLEKNGKAILSVGRTFVTSSNTKLAPGSSVIRKTNKKGEILEKIFDANGNSDRKRFTIKHSEVSGKEVLHFCYEFNEPIDVTNSSQETLSTIKAILDNTEKLEELKLCLRFDGNYKPFPEEIQFERNSSYRYTLFTNLGKVKEYMKNKKTRVFYQPNDNQLEVILASLK